MASGDAPRARRAPRCESRRDRRLPARDAPRDDLGPARSFSSTEVPCSGTKDRRWKASDLRHSTYLDQYDLKTRRKASAYYADRADSLIEQHFAHQVKGLLVMRSMGRALFSVLPLFIVACGTGSSPPTT